MEAKLENLEGLKRKYTFSIKWEDVNAEVDTRIKKAQKKAKIQGFRPGKAPLKMVASMYGAGINEEVVNETVQKAFFQVIVDQKIKMAGYPSFEAQKEQPDEKLLTIDATFEVYPEVTIGDLSSKEVEKVSCQVSDAEVEKTIDVLRKQRTRFERVEREAKEGDRVIIDFKGTVDGEAFEGGSATNFPFVLGEGRMLPDFETGIKGMKEGETKDINVTFPEDYHSKDLAGKNAVFAITVHNVAQAELPEVDEAFAKSLGITDGSVEKMREEIKKNVEREVKRRTAEMTKESAMQALLDATEIQLPNALVQEEIVRLMNEMRQNFANQGLDPKTMPQLPAEMFQQQAERRVSLGLILAHLVDSNKLEAKDEQVKALVEEFADSYEDPEEVVQWYYSDKKNLQGPTSLVLESNVVDYVLEQAKVNEKNMTFDDIMDTQARTA
ncbi:trigger factor [Neisseria sp. Ec49-e6-T10]|uniref:trigger factor n=1 Tax=Neisseria sp. Ec49-e6-T10 TaxID=3140744 RepID=UPI003EBDC1B4